MNQDVHMCLWVDGNSSNRISLCVNHQVSIIDQCYNWRFKNVIQTLFISDLHFHSIRYKNGWACFEYLWKRWQFWQHLLVSDLFINLIVTIFVLIISKTHEILNAHIVLNACMCGSMKRDFPLQNLKEREDLENIRFTSLDRTRWKQISGIDNIQIVYKP